MSSERDIELMRRALALARDAASNGEIPVGAVIAHNGAIIAEGYNQIETLSDATAHAEILAIREASKYARNWRLGEMALYVTLEPCPMCMGAIRLSRISRVVFGASDPRMGAAGSFCDLTASQEIGPVPTVVGGLLGEEASALLKEFFRGIRGRNLQ